MADSRMSRDEWLGFLRSPVRPAMLATTRKDGRPHVVPVWYDLDDDGAVLFNTGARSVKGRSLRRDDRVALCVQDERPPFSYVSISGRAQVIEDLGEIRRWATRIGGRYMGADRAEEFGTRNGVPGELLVRITPDDVVAHRDIAD